MTDLGTLLGHSLGGLPLLAYLGLWLLVLGRRCAWAGRLGPGGAGVLAAAGIVAWTLLGTLGLSSFGGLTKGLVTGWWVLGTALVWGWAAARWRFVRDAWRDVRDGTGRWCREEWVLLTALLGVLGCALLMAILSPPNNADSFKYHLPRQLFWIAQHTVFLTSAPFEHMLRQPPLAEYIGVNLMLLSGGDRLNNLVQFAALVHVLLLLSLILQANGHGWRSVLYAGLFLATFPAAFYEASNTKNDLVVTAFLLAIVWILSGLPRARSVPYEAAMAVGFFAGCALLTKGTAIPYLAVIGLCAVLFVISGRLRVNAGATALGLLITVGIASTHYLRQGRAIAHGESGTTSQHVSARFDPTSALSVLVRNIATVLATPSELLNGGLGTAVNALHASIGRQVDDPANTFRGQTFDVRYVPREEDRPPAPVHTLWLLLLPGLVWLIGERSVRAQCLHYAALYGGMLLAFSAVFRWQPWHARLLIPVVAVAALPVGIVLARVGGGGLRAALLIVLLAAWSPSLDLRARPLIGRGSVLLQADSKLLFAHLAEDGYVIESLSRVMAKLQPRTVVVDTLDASVYPILRSLGIAAGRPVELLGPGARKPEAVDAILRFRHVAASGAGVDPQGDKEPEELTLVRDRDGWRLWLRGERAAEVAEPAFFPAFYGFTAVSGLGPPQGPYAEFRLPVFRNAYGDQVVVTVPGSPLRRTLYLELLPYRGPQEVHLHIDGRQPVALVVGTANHPVAALTLPLGVDTQPFRIAMSIQGPWSSSADAVDRVLLRVSRLQIIPDPR